MNNDKKSYMLPLLIIGGMFVILGFSIGINAFFIPFIKEAFNISTGKSYLIMTATFSAYVIFGIPSGVILKRIGYKGGITAAFLLIALGFFVIGYAAHIISFVLFLIALFVVGMGQTLLTGAINSYVTILGPHESAASRICIMGICDKLAFSGASLILAGFLDLTNVRLEDAIFPFYIITVIMVVIGVLSYYSPLPELKAEGEDEDEITPEESQISVYANSKTSILQFPHLMLGVMAIFFDVGVEIIALGSINDFASELNLASPEHYVWFVTIGMVVGYLFGVKFIPKVVSQSQALMWCTILGTLTVLAIVLVPTSISIYLVGVLGFTNSLLWPAIFPLALADLGKFTKTGSSLLVMGIIGGAILPLIFGYLADVWTYQLAYLVCLPSYLFIFYFAVWGNKIRTRGRGIVPA